jgi:hypothetical protein
MALGTARTCSSLSSSGVIILIRLGRLPEGESRVPPPLEAARASIVLLSFGTRAGRMRTRRERFRVYGKRQVFARPEDVGRPNRFQSASFLSTSVNVSASTAITFFSDRGGVRNRPRIRLIAHAP